MKLRISLRRRKSVLGQYFGGVQINWLIPAAASRIKVQYVLLAGLKKRVILMLGARFDNEDLRKLSAS